MKTYKKLLPSISLIKQKSDIPCAQISSSKDAADYVRQFFGTDIEIFESMFLLLLNRNNITEGYVKISQGGTAGTVCDVKLIAKYAIESLADGVILVHNHPSGNTKPSVQDEMMTNKVKNALFTLDVKLLDHLIITSNDGFYSFADEGNL